MKARQLNPYAQKWLLDSFYSSIANGQYTTARVSDEKLGYYHKRHVYTDLLSTMYVNKSKAIGFDDRGFTIDEQIKTGFEDKEALAAMYDNMSNAKRLDKIGVSYDMQANLGKKLGKYFQGFYDKTEEMEGFVSKNNISPILLTSYFMQEGNMEYLMSESNPQKAAQEAKKMQGCNYFLQTTVPNMVAGLFAKNTNESSVRLPEDVGRIVGQKLVDISNGAKDYRGLVRLSQLGSGVFQMGKS